MSNTEYMGVSPSKVSGQSGNHSSLKQTTSEEACEFGAECIHSEPLESKHLLGSEAAPNKPQEISSAVTRSPDNEKLQAFCGDVLDKSFTEHLVLPPEDVSKSSQTNNILCSQENTLDQKHEICSECVHSEKSERKHQLEFHIVCNEPREISSVMCSSGDNDKLRPVFQDASKCSQINSKNTLEFRSVNGCVELDTRCVCSKTSEQNYQLGSEIMHKEPANTDAVVTSGVVHENLQTTSEDMTKIIPTEPLQSPLGDVNNRFQTGEKSCPQQSTSERTPEVTAGIASHEPLEVNDKHDFLLVQNRPTEISTATTCYISTEKLGSPSEFVIKSSPIEHLKQPEVPITTPISEHLGPYSDNMTKNSSLEQSETPSKRAVNNSRSLGRKGKKASKALKKKYMLRSLRGNDRVLRSTSGRKSKALESSNHLADVSSIRGRKRQKQKNRRGKIAADEYSRIRTHLRYLVNRINYEQSLIAAYSSEGWKGLSIEKLKPEKELQRATSEILRRKLKIRDLFQRLDSLCSEGGFPKSLFDSEGQIDSEDIFCAKCGSKELLADNDIILCDGACDRGFHQYCLEPPLLKEDIPPDDEGWLCPGCDCKVDCIDLVNELHGKNLFITDKWEKVFPEAAAAAGHNQDPNFGLLSDDSDDDDYDPDGPAIVKKDQGDESSSDESDFSSTSDDLEASANGQEYLGLPSDDSEDDEYNPDAPELNDKVMQESSSSDFTSDSEDLAAVVEDSGSSGNEEGAISVSPLRDSNGKRSKLGGNEESLNNELLSILESGKDGAAPVYGKRSIERLDYKKLYDETYAHVPSDSSDDEDWSENDGPMKRTKSTREGFSVSPNGTAPGTRSGKNTKDTKKNIKEVEHIPKRRGCRKLNSEDTNISHEGSSIPGSTKRERSSYKRLGEDVTQKLYKSFKENWYPDRSKKETLAKELGITFSQVSKWFENTRWSFNHSSSMDARMGTIALEKTSCTPQPNNRSVRRVSTCSVSENVESPKTAVDDTRYSSGDVKDSELVTEESGRRKPTTRLSRKRKQKDKLEHQASCTDSKIEVIHALAADSPKVQETQTNGRTRRRRNSAS